MNSITPEQQLDSFIDKFLPEIASTTRDAIGKMRLLLPGALELVYDNYNALAIGYSPTEKTSEVIFSIAVYPKWVSLFFMQASGMVDPDGLLKGSGKIVKHTVLEESGDIDSAAVRALMASALVVAKVPLDLSLPYRLIIKSISEKQRPRRPSK